MHEKPAFKRAFRSRRLLIPVDGFYEWFPTPEIGKAGKPLKQPFYIHPADPDEILALAGIYEFWRDPDVDDGDPGAWLTSFTIITTTATDHVGRIHDRMPMAVERANWDAWLDPRVKDVDQIRGELIPASAAPTSPPPGRFGDLSRAGLDELVQLAGTVWDVDAWSPSCDWTTAQSTGTSPDRFAVSSYSRPTTDGRSPASRSRFASTRAAGGLMRDRYANDEGP